MTQKTNEAIQIANKIKNDIQEGKSNISQIVRQYYDLVTLIGNKDEAKWASEESDGYKDIKNIPDYRIIIVEKNKCTFIKDDCDKIEQKSQSDSLYYESYVYSNYLIIDGTFGVEPERFADIVKNIKNRIYRETTNILIDLKFGGIIETIFEDTKKLVDSKLVDVCPDAIEKFTSAYERLRETNPESWAQAVTTCRRILKDFADVIYPPKDELVDGRKLGEEEYKNRLWAFASENIKSDTNKKLIQSELEYIGQRINSIYELTCKGTHADISRDEAERAIIRTYLLIGDLIKLGGL